MSEDGRPAGSGEDARAAAGLVVSLSSYVVTAALAVLGAQAVVVTFILDKRTHLMPFYITTGLGGLALISSVIVGGWGIYEIAVAGAKGRWTVRTKGGKFNMQSVLALLGAILVVTSAFLGDPK